MSLATTPPARPEEIIIVSGLPRSGTSMMMAILKAGGVEILTDEIRTADEDNLNGYFELEMVKKLREGSSDWLANAPGKAVKVISALLEYLPTQYHYKILFMQRQIEEVLASQKQMLIRRGQPTDTVSDEKLSRLYHHHLEKIEGWLAEQKNIQVLDIHYSKVIDNPQKNIAAIIHFLGKDLNADRMMSQVNSNFYRQRQTP